VNLLRFLIQFGSVRSFFLGRASSVPQLPRQSRSVLESAAARVFYRAAWFCFHARAKGFVFTAADFSLPPVSAPAGLASRRTAKFLALRFGCPILSVADLQFPVIALIHLLCIGPKTMFSGMCMRVRIAKLHMRTSCHSSSTRKTSRTVCTRPVYPGRHAQFHRMSTPFLHCLCGLFPHPQGRSGRVSLRGSAALVTIFDFRLELGGFSYAQSVRSNACKVVKSFVDISFECEFL
jgi:hypothetical protein